MATWQVGKDGSGRRSLARHGSRWQHDDLANWRGKVPTLANCPSLHPTA